MSSIEQGKIKFKNPQKPIKIDGHPFPINTVEVNDQKVATRIDEFTRAEKLGVIDPNIHISVGELKYESRYEYWKSSKMPRKKVTFQMLPNKFQL